MKSSSRLTVLVAGLVRTLTTLGYTGPVGLLGYNLKGDPVENLKRSMAAWRQISGQHPQVPQ